MSSSSIVSVPSIDDYEKAKASKASAIIPTSEGPSSPPAADAPPPDSIASEPVIAPVPFSSLFIFAKPSDLLIFALGCFGCVAAAAVLPAINIVFGELMDTISSPTDIAVVMQRAVYGMCGLAGAGFVTFFTGYFCIAYAASNIANAFRIEYLKAVLRQDATFFDAAMPGAISLTLSDAALDIQTGLSDSFAGAVQGVFQFFFGFAVAFYFGWRLSLVLLGCTPALIAVTVALFKFGVEDGVFGRKVSPKFSPTVTCFPKPPPRR